MWCDPPSVPSKQLSFVYQPGVGLYDKKNNDFDQDLPITSTIDDIDERIQENESSIFTSDVDHRSSNLYKSYLRRQNEQDSLPIRKKFFSSDDILSDKNHHIKLFDVNLSTNQKRKFDQNLFSNKKLRYSTDEILPNSTDENLKCEKNLLDEELNRQKAKFLTIEEQKHKQQSLPIKLRKNSNEKLQKQSITTIIKSIPMVKKSSSEKEPPSIPSQGLLLCPKEEPIKKKKKKKIAPTITSSTALLDDDSVLDSILFDEIQSVQQQWQQLLVLTMEKELHINPSDGKKKIKLNKFHRTNEFLLAYENLYDFEGMKHWCPTSR